MCLICGDGRHGSVYVCVVCVLCACVRACVCECLCVCEQSFSDRQGQ